MKNLSMLGKVLVCYLSFLIAIILVGQFWYLSNQYFSDVLFSLLVAFLLFSSIRKNTTGKSFFFNHLKNKIRVDVLHSQIEKEDELREIEQLEKSEAKRISAVDRLAGSALFGTILTLVEVLAIPEVNDFVSRAYYGSAIERIFNSELFIIPLSIGVPLLMILLLIIAIRKAIKEKSLNVK